MDIQLSETASGDGGRDRDVPVAAGQAQRPAPPSGRRCRARAGRARPGASWPGRPGRPRRPRGRAGAGGPTCRRRVAASAARTSRRISSESEMLPRLSRTVTGVTASATAAISPAPGAGHAADGAVEDEHGQRALDDLGQDEGPDVEAEQPGPRAPGSRRRRAVCRPRRCPTGRRRRRRSCASSATCCGRRRRRTSRADRRSCPSRTRARRAPRRRAARAGPTTAGRRWERQNGGDYVLGARLRARPGPDARRWWLEHVECPGRVVELKPPATSPMGRTYISGGGGQGADPVAGTGHFSPARTRPEPERNEAVRWATSMSRLTEQSCGGGLDPVLERGALLDGPDVGDGDESATRSEDPHDLATDASSGSQNWMLLTARTPEKVASGQGMSVRRAAFERDLSAGDGGRVAAPRLFDHRGRGVDAADRHPAAVAAPVRRSRHPDRSRWRARSRRAEAPVRRSPPRSMSRFIRAMTGPARRPAVPSNPPARSGLAMLVSAIT